MPTHDRQRALLLSAGSGACVGFCWCVYTPHVIHGRYQPQVFYNIALKVGTDSIFVINNYTTTRWPLTVYSPIVYFVVFTRGKSMYRQWLITSASIQGSRIPCDCRNINLPFSPAITQPRRTLYFLLSQGENAEAILNLQPRSSVARRAEIASQTPISASKQPLSEHPDSHRSDSPSSSTSPLTSLNEKTTGQNLGRTHRPQLGTSTGRDGQRKGASLRLSREKRCTGSKMVGSGRKDQGDSGGSEDGDLVVGNDARKPGPIESRGDNKVNVRRRSARTFCGWQRPLWQADGINESGNSGSVGVVSKGEVTKSPTPDFTKHAEGNHTQHDEGGEVSSLTIRKFDGRNDSDSGGVSSTISTTTPMSRKQGISLGQSYLTEAFSGHAESSSSTIDLASTMPSHGCPAVATTSSQAPANHFNAPSVKLSFAAKGSYSLPSVAQQSDMDVDVAFRRPLYNRDVEFAGKNFGDSILGECSFSEDPSATVGSHDWNVREGCDSYGGGGADDMATRDGRKDLVNTGLNSTSFDGSAPIATLCGKDVPKTSGRGFGGVLSPNQLPSTPSPLSLDRPTFHSMQCLMGL